MIRDGRDLKQARQELGLSVFCLADSLRMGANGERTIRRWERDELSIPGPAAIAIEAMLAGFMPEIDETY